MSGIFIFACFSGFEKFYPKGSRPKVPEGEPAKAPGTKLVLPTMLSITPCSPAERPTEKPAEPSNNAENSNNKKAGLMHLFVCMARSIHL